ncbi:hypothetical protein SF83666_c09310 [Sinorhizobium fredii CCBAU 83666]|nr:hypothetical protein SF83666_c09310 [Sinorhizobium fredii CCBAU 83666]
MRDHACRRRWLNAKGKRQGREARRCFKRPAAGPGRYRDCACSCGPKTRNARPRPSAKKAVAQRALRSQKARPAAATTCSIRECSSRAAGRDRRRVRCRNGLCR